MQISEDKQKEISMWLYNWHFCLEYEIVIVCLKLRIVSKVLLEIADQSNPE